MGSYVTARKIEENDEYVIYACGNSTERLCTTFRIDKAALECALTDPRSHFTVKDAVTILDNGHKCSCLAVWGRILSYHKENNLFPDKISKQS